MDRDWKTKAQTREAWLPHGRTEGQKTEAKVQAEAQEAQAKEAKAEAQAEEAKAQPEKTRRLERVSVEITLLHCINMTLY